MKWYLAELIFAQKRSRKRKLYFCETSVVLIRAGSAQDAYDKTLAWADDYLKVTGLFKIEFLGVARLEKILDSRIRHGTEISGTTFFRKQPWNKNSGLIPPKSALTAFMCEHNAHKPFGEILEKVRGKAFMNRCRKRYEQ